jgi:hypothetical protein
MMCFLPFDTHGSVETLRNFRLTTAHTYDKMLMLGRIATRRLSHSMESYFIILSFLCQFFFCYFLPGVSRVFFYAFWASFCPLLIGNKKQRPFFAKEALQRYILL